MAYQDIILSDGPELYWPVQNGTGTPTALVGDSPTQSGGVWTSDPLFGECQSLNGTSTHISREGVFTHVPEGNAARTIEGWCWLNSVPGTLFAYGYLYNSNQHCILQVGATAFITGDGAYSIPWTTVTPTGRWCYIAFTYAGGTAGAAVFYLNGVADVTTTMTLGTTPSNDRCRNGLRSDDSRGTTYLNGKVAHTAVYSSALTADQVKAHYLAGVRSGVMLG